MKYIRKNLFSIGEHAVGLLLVYLAVTVGGEPIRQIIIAAIGLAIMFNGAKQAERRLEK